MPGFGPLGSFPVSGILSSETPEGHYYPLPKRVLVYGNTPITTGFRPINVSQVSRLSLLNPDPELKITQATRLSLMDQSPEIKILQAARLSLLVEDPQLKVTQVVRLTLMASDVVVEEAGGTFILW